jgi:hypothetical protein
MARSIYSRRSLWAACGLLGASHHIFPRDHVSQDRIAGLSNIYEA